MRSIVSRAGPGASVESFLVSAGIVALAEIGDKTQLLAFVLCAKYRKPLPIIAGIFLATVANHALAGAVGAWITSLVAPQTLQWVLGVSFLAMAVWTLVPDKLDENDAKVPPAGVMVATLIAFFLVEMGDKTQIATVALAAEYHAFYSVVAGTTAGIMIANVPAVMLGERIARRMPVRLLRQAAALIFALLGLATLAAPGMRVKITAANRPHSVESAHVRSNPQHDLSQGLYPVRIPDRYS
jgi:putative Ca2+/H+ antiporter (TMEM165/GDT1 family)